jgi:adenosylcobyric acid synthase
MRAISILGTSSNAGKSWLTTALGAWLRRQGVNVAPFKAQNMSNNSFATLEGGEMGRAQAVQAIACGLRPVAAMNPILLKPCGHGRSQLVILGEPGEVIAARDYYQKIEHLWEIVAATLEGWRDRCDVLLLEGAGSPVELNLMHRDLVNLRPVLHLDGRWLLVGDIERGGIFAQAVGTVNLMPPAARSRGLGLIVNKFRGDLSLFSTADIHFKEHLPDLPYLGTLPHRDDLQPESEDSLCQLAETGGEGPAIAWIRLPFLSNSQDVQPWLGDRGVQIRWVDRVADLAGARAIVIPGSKNTLRDLQWLRETGLAAAIQGAAAAGVPVVGICGGYQMLGDRLMDGDGAAGDRGDQPGLGLLPVTTTFQAHKTIRQVQAHWPAGDRAPWQAYEIHMGQTITTEPLDSLVQVQDLEHISHAIQEVRPEGYRKAHIWGTYLHGLFESPAVRQALAIAAQMDHYQPNPLPWEEQQRQQYNAMADLLEAHLDLEPIRRYLDLPQ